MKEPLRSQISPAKGRVAAAALYNKTVKASEQARDKYQQMKDGAAELYTEGKRNFTHIVEERPLSSLLIAGGIGFLLAALRRNSVKINSKKR